MLVCASVLVKARGYDKGWAEVRLSGGDGANEKVVESMRLPHGFIPVQAPIPILFTALRILMALNSQAVEDLVGIICRYKSHTYKTTINKATSRIISRDPRIRRTSGSRENQLLLALSTAG
jgi:hypothetical protein